MKGAPEMVIKQCTFYLKNATPIPMSAKDVERIGDVVTAMASRGLRGIASSALDLYCTIRCSLVPAHDIVKF